MFIQTQTTPNPATIKFLPGQNVLESGTAEFKSAGEAANSPLAQRLFALQGVENVFFGRDFVSISKAADTDWQMLKPMILGALMEHFSTGQPVLLHQEEEKFGVQAGDSDVVAQIKELIESRVRPAVARDHPAGRSGHRPVHGGHRRGAKGCRRK